MVDAVESIPRQLLKDKKVISRYVDNIALEARSVDSDTFPGITCSSYVPLNRQGVYLEDSFSCTGHGNRSDEPPHGKVSTSRCFSAVNRKCRIFCHVFRLVWLKGRSPKTTANDHVRFGTMDGPIRVSVKSNCNLPRY